MSGLTREQLAIRRTRIGSSDIGAILGVSGRTALDVFNDKVLPIDDAPSPEMEWGSAIERRILEYHAEREGLALTFPGTLVHPQHDFICDTPDAIGIGGTGKLAVESKNVGFYNSSEWGDEGDDAPFGYLAQVHWHIGVCKAHELVGDVGHLVPSIGGTPPRKYVVQFDPELFGIMVQRAEQFVRDYLKTGRPPALDGSPAADEYLRRKYGVHSDDLLPFDEEADAMRLAIFDIESKEKWLETERVKLRQQISDLIGDKAGVEGVATWKRCKDSVDNVTDWKWIAEKLGTRFAVERDVFEALVAENTRQVVTRQGSRRLTLNRPRAKKAKAA